MSAPTPTTCPSCTGSILIDQLYCEACGHAVGDEAPPPDQAPDAACVECAAPLDRQGDGYCAGCGTKQPEPGGRCEAADRNVAAVSDRGRRRTRNEDAFAVSTTSEGRALAVVCDGVSTTTNPDQAATQAATAAMASLQQVADHLPGTDALAAAFTAARSAVNAVAWTQHGTRGAPSCTFLAAVAAGGTVALASMGDCRAFWLPEQGEPETLTIDDSWANDQVQAGFLSSEAAHADPRSHSITRWLGRDADSSWQPPPIVFTAAGPGRLVLCSDGLWNYADGATDVAAVAGPGDALAVAHRLVDHANLRGGHDNITVAVIDIPGCPHVLVPSPTEGSTS